MLLFFYGYGLMFSGESELDNNLNIEVIIDVSVS